MDKTIAFDDRTRLPAIGQGTWYMGEEAARRGEEVAALQAGLDAGLTLIDTAEMYAEGGAEEVVGEALRGRRDSAFIVSKVYPWHAGEVDAVEACERSLRRLDTDRLDLYLLHWRGNVPLEETIRAMETLQQQGKILRWGVSNFDVDDLQELLSEPGGARCATNQVLYHLASRGIEFDLLPECQQRQMPVMAYCPLAQAGRLRQALFADSTLVEIAQQKGISVAQLLLAWVIRKEGVMAIPKASSQAHVKENAAALHIRLDDDELARINKAFPPPQRKMALDVV
jgi:diketogulonate reductase-like aldo/keto reductase